VSALKRSPGSLVDAPKSWLRAGRGESGANQRAQAGGADTAAQVEVINAQKRFGSFEAVAGVSFTVAQGSFTTLLGSSGSGKTTMLRLIAGLERLEGGTIRMSSRVVASSKPAVHVPPDKRRVGLVFQNFSLWPHMTVFDQVAYPLKVRRERTDMKTRVRNALSLVGLLDLAGRYPSELSGGQQQRVSLARALVYEPSVLLLDEPLSALDAALRVYMRAELQSIHRRLGVTIVYVTHDQSEALSLSDNIILMSRGKIIQQGTPRQIYDEPGNVETARFVGGSNVLSGSICGIEGSNRVRVKLNHGGSELEVNSSTLQGPPEVGAPVVIAVKPEDVDLGMSLPGDRAITLQPEVQNVAYIGSHTEITLNVDGETFLVRTDKSTDIRVGASLPICLPAACVRVFNDSQ
jgi:ABC-type Fe3+/spermidine/putrescine transport system ATPase subunit